MRKHLMLSTAAVGLMLASGFAYAQAPGERRDEPKRTEEPAKGAAPQRGGVAQDRGQERGQERAQGAQERLQGAGREEKGGAAKHGANDDKRQPASSAERDQPKAKDQAQEAREPSRDRNREAESAKPGRDTGKSSAETKQDKSAPPKSSAESEKSKTGPAGQQNERTGAASNQNERNQAQPPRNAAEQHQPAQQNNRPAAATDTSRTAPTNNAQTAPGTAGTQTNQANQTTQTNTQVNQQTQLTSEKQVRISETVSRARLAQPERNLNISIRVGETIPSRVRLYRLPPEIVSIEPQYRDYEYFATDDDVVIVEPRTHRIVSQVPRDPSRARAQMGGGAAPSSTSSSNVNCQIMRRDASGNVAQAEPSTVGSTARSDSLSVTVQMPGGGSSAPIALGAPAGNIVVATQGQGDCTVTLEPQTR